MSRASLLQKLRRIDPDDDLPVFVGTADLADLTEIIHAEKDLYLAQQAAGLATLVETTGENPAVEAAVAHLSAEVRAAIAPHLWRLGWDRAEVVLTRLMADPDPDVRLLAVHSAARLLRQPHPGGGRLVGAVAALGARDPLPYNRSFAALVTGVEQAGALRASELMEALQRGVVPTDVALVVGPGDVDAVLEAAQSPVGIVATGATEVAASLAPSDAVLVVDVAASSEDASVRRTAARVAQQLEDAVGVDLLDRLLADPDAEVRSATLVAIARRTDTDRFADAIGRLAASDDDERVRGLAGEVRSHRLRRQPPP
jgi:HEAT repeat protein